MDPLTVLSIAGNVVQFVDFASKLVSKGYRIYTTAQGGKAENEQLQTLTEDIRDIAVKLDRSLALELQGPINQRTQSEPHSNEDLALKMTCQKCCFLANELLEQLEKLKVRGKKHREWRSFRQALKAVYNKGRLEEMRQQLESIRSQLDLHLLLTHRAALLKLSSRQDTFTSQLDDSTRAVISAFFKSQQGFTQELHLHSDRLVRLEQRDSSGLKFQKPGTRFNEVHRGAEKYHAADWSSRTTADDRRVKVEVKILAIESSILDSLRFSSMDERYEEIDEAHKSTFKWILDSTLQDETMRSPSSGFAQWLKTGGGIFWINGKAGSGKSTLMRYLYSHPHCLQLLNEWSSNANIAGFFFWLSGTPEQRSQRGLIRSILHQLLHKNRSLIPVVMREIWTSSDSKPLELVVTQALEPWSLASLKRRLLLLLEHVTRTQKLCIFIDGLDEYEGDQTEIIELISSIARSPSTKVCISSRPLIVYEDAFSGCPGFRLQDLIQGDIQNYIKSAFEDIPKMVQLARDEPQRWQEFRDEIIRNANGVFLWVKLVVQSLLEGLRNRDRMGDLYRRLRELPATLDGLYEHMLKKIQPKFYLEQAAEIFQIVQVANTNYGNRQNAYDAPSLTLIALALADHENPETAYRDIQTMSENEALCACQEMDIRLRSRCVGLLETVNFRWDRLDPERGAPGVTVYGSRFAKALPRSPQAQKLLARKSTSQFGTTSQVLSMSKRALTTQQVYYLHRTVKDFLNQAHIQDSLAKAISSPLFDPALSMLKSCVLQLKLFFPLERMYLVFPQSHYAQHFWSVVEDALSYADKLGFSAKKTNSDVLDELNKIVSRHWVAAKRGCQDANLGSWPLDVPSSPRRAAVIRRLCSHDPFLALAAQRGLVYYVHKKVVEKTVVCEDCSVWIAVLEYCQMSLPSITQDENEKPDLNAVETWLKIIEHLVCQGVDASARTERSKGTVESALTVVDVTFMRYVPVAAGKLRGILTETMKGPLPALSGLTLNTDIVDPQEPNINEIQL